MIFDTRVKNAIAAAERGDFDQATSTVIDLVAEDWNNAEAHSAWGHVLLAQGKTIDAVESYRTALSLDPRGAEVYFDLAGALLEVARADPFLPLTNWLEAQDAVHEGLKRWPNNELGLRLFDEVEDLRTRAIS